MPCRAQWGHHLNGQGFIVRVASHYNDFPAKKKSLVNDSKIRGLAASYRAVRGQKKGMFVFYLVAYSPSPLSAPTASPPTRDGTRVVVPPSASSLQSTKATTMAKREEQTATAAAAVDATPSSQRSSC